MIIVKSLERQNEILAILRAVQKELRIEELAAVLNVSPLTVRRDLQKLARDKTIIRTHGGCILVGRAALETEYRKKVTLNFELKQAIGRVATKHIEPGSVLLINDGSTTFHLSSHLGGIGPLTIYTNSLAMISELGRFREITLYLLGGQYNPELYSLYGEFAERTVELLSCDMVFLGVDAIDKKGRCLVTTAAEARLTQVMLRAGKKKILLADHTKVGAKGYVAYGTLQDFDTWVTTPGINKKMLYDFKRLTCVVEAAE